ncbi:hypothetical protein FS749_004824 [Ceratobasidium sp. UAMH 11750]|nr:hypothetical protein FS749_004824 [Ceratobasidium sp. UAMH 11750]
MAMGVTSYYDANTEGMVYLVTPDPQADVESPFGDDTDSSASDATIHTDDLPGYFILHNGRQQPVSNNIARWFPADNVRRFILRSLASKWIFGGNYIGPAKALAPLAGRKREALELGTRAGTWVQEMAKEFPDVHFRTIDVAPIIAHAPCSNITFEVYDFTQGLLLPNDSQDAVFLNIVFELVKDYRALLREAHRVLRPGGLLYINDFNPHLWDAQNTSIPAYRTNPVGCRVFDLARAQIAKFGIDPDTCDKLPRWLAPESDLWGTRAGGGGFENIRTIIKAYPAYPHDGMPCALKPDPRLAPYIAHLSVLGTRDMYSILRDGGMEEEQAERLVEEMIEEMRRPECCALLKPYCVYAFKRSC